MAYEMVTMMDLQTVFQMKQLMEIQTEQMILAIRKVLGMEFQLEM
jgi:hypothetical protein